MRNLGYCYLVGEGVARDQASHGQPSRAVPPKSVDSAAATRQVDDASRAACSESKGVAPSADDH
jgi:hypothetical protein